MNMKKIVALFERILYNFIDYIIRFLIVKHLDSTLCKSRFKKYI